MFDFRNFKCISEFRPLSMKGLVGGHLNPLRARSSKQRMNLSAPWVSQTTQVEPCLCKLKPCRFCHSNCGNSNFIKPWRMVNLFKLGKTSADGGFTFCKNTIRFETFLFNVTWRLNICLILSRSIVNNADKTQILNTATHSGTYSILNTIHEVAQLFMWQVMCRLEVFWGK